MNPTTDQVCEQPFRINKFEWKIASDELQNSRLFLPSPVVPFNKQMPSERDIQDIEENRRLLGLLANTRDENAIKLEETSSKESKKSIEKDITVRQGSEKSIESVITVGQGSEKCTVENGWSNLGTVENAPDGQSCDSSKRTYSVRKVDSVLYQDSCLQTSRNESTMNLLKIQISPQLERSQKGVLDVICLEVRGTHRIKNRETNLLQFLVMQFGKEFGICQDLTAIQLLLVFPRELLLKRIVLHLC